MIDDKTLAKMEDARHLLEPPADKVVGDLLNEIAALKERQLWVDSLIAAFVVPHETLDDENTPGKPWYDDLMASWALALTGLRAYYHDHIIAAQRREGEENEAMHDTP